MAGALYISLKWTQYAVVIRFFRHVFFPAHNIYFQIENTTFCHNISRRWFRSVQVSHSALNRYKSGVLDSATFSAQEVMIMQKTLFNAFSKNCCAYCTYHHCAVTVRQLKVKKCLLKECSHLQKNPEHQYWQQRERVKQLRKARKAAFASILNWSSPFPDVFACHPFHAHIAAQYVLHKN